MKRLALAILAAPWMAIPPVALAQPEQVPSVRSGPYMVGPGYFVTDMDRSLQFYRDILGMKIRMKFGSESHPDIVLGFGSEMTEPSIMLLSDRKGPEPRPVQHGHGYSRLAITVPDLAAIRQRLHEFGYVTEKPRTVHGAFLMMMVGDPDGYQIELLQPIKAE